jgi:hypothetical protein
MLIGVRNLVFIFSSGLVALQKARCGGFRKGIYENYNCSLPAHSIDDAVILADILVGGVESLD